MKRLNNSATRLLVGMAEKINASITLFFIEENDDADVSQWNVYTLNVIGSLVE